MKIMNKNMVIRVIVGMLLALVLCGCKTAKSATIPKPSHIPEQHREAHRKLLREQHQLMIQTSNSSREDTESMLPT